MLAVVMGLILVIYLPIAKRFDQMMARKQTADAA
jgi:hypothetical protein